MTISVIQNKSSTGKRRVWSSCCLVILLLVLLIVTMPFVKNYCAIQHFKEISAHDIRDAVETEPGRLLKRLPLGWESWLRNNLPGNCFYPFEEMISLTLDGIPVKDADLIYLNGLTQLRGLFLDNTQVTDQGLVHLKGLTNLKSLYFHNAPITNAGLVHFEGLKKLEVLYLHNSKVTQAGVKKLKKTIPKCGVSLRR